MKHIKIIENPINKYPKATMRVQKKHKKSKVDDAGNTVLNE